MSSLVLPLVLLVVGCAPPASPTFGSGGSSPPDAWLDGWYQDHFSVTWELCGRPEEFRPYDPMFLVHVDQGTLERLVSWECVDQILDDQGFDYAALHEEGRTLSDTYRYRLAMPGYALLSTPMGSLVELDERVASGADEWLASPFVDELSTLGRLSGESDVRPVLYDYVMSSIARTVWDMDLEATSTLGRVDLEERTLYTYPPSGDEYLQQATTLVHEATHIWRQQAHVSCESGCFDVGEHRCDETWAGPYGYGAGTATLLSDHIPWESEPELAEQQADELYGQLIAPSVRVLEVCSVEE